MLRCVIFSTWKCWTGRIHVPGGTEGDGRAHLIYCASQIMWVLFCFFFKQIQSCGNPSSSKSISANFLTAVFCTWASQRAQTVKNLPAMQETQVQPLGREDPLEREWGPTAVFLPRESHGQRRLEDYSPEGHKKSDTTE